MSNSRHGAALPVYRSLLFVPGNRPDRFDKALASGADAVIVDLEDAVAPDAKDAARATLAAWAAPAHPVLVRINARGTEWFEQDILLGRLPGIAGIVLPKAGSAQDVTRVVAAARRRVPVLPIIESAQGIWNVEAVARAPGTRRLLFGTLDFIVDMGMPDDGDALSTFRAQLALVSRVAGLAPPVDGVMPDLQDNDRLVRETLRGKSFGFGGKLCIHPAQVKTVNDCYRPSDAELAWATRVLAAVAAAGGNAVSVDGGMVDRPVVLKAERILAQPGVGTA